MEEIEFKEKIDYYLIDLQKDDNEALNYLYDLTKSNLVEEIDVRDEHGKKFKDFKKEFYESFEKIVAPVFYQTQATYMSKLKKADIKFNMTESESIFTIAQGELKSELTITYPTYIKVIIDIKHFAENENPVIRRLTYDFEDFSEERLSSILKDVINEFSERQSLIAIKAE